MFLPSTAILSDVAKRREWKSARGMESIVRNVAGIDAAQRQLRDNQEVIVMVLNPGVVPGDQTRQQAAAGTKGISIQAAKKLQDQGVSPEVADAAVDEVMERVRAVKEQ